MVVCCICVVFIVLVEVSVTLVGVYLLEAQQICHGLLADLKSVLVK